MPEQQRTVGVEIADAVATITIERAESMNALDTATKVALRDAVLQVAADDAVRAVVLTGSGRAFCVGQDLREHIGNLTEDQLAVWSTVREHFNPTALALATMPKPVVAAVNGVAAGAGASLAFACDFRVVAETAGFNLAFTAIGLSPDSGSSWTLPRLVGQAKATELLMLGGTISAQDADRLGLVTRLVPAEDVLSSAQELATRLAGGATIAYGCVKRAVAYGTTHTLEESLAFEDEMQSVAGTSQDHLDAAMSFVRKEKPVFRNR